MRQLPRLVSSQSPRRKKYNHVISSAEIPNFLQLLILTNNHKMLGILIKF